MAITVTIYPEVSFGYVRFKYTGDGATAAPVIVGFMPSKVEIYNTTDQAGQYVWTASMASATGIKNGATQVATNGIVPQDQNVSGGIGFNLGTDASINTSAKVYDGIAWR